MPAGYAVGAVGRLHLALCGRANKCMSTLEPLLLRCEARSPPRTPLRTLWKCRVPKNTSGQFRGSSMHGALAALSRSLEGGNGNRQRPIAQTTGLQQLARDKPLSCITVLLRPIPNACPHVCRNA
jgi:hypothetical protein